MRADIINILEKHQGKDSAIKGKDIACLLGQRSDRKARLIIRDLIEEGYPIASTVSDPKGYFMIQTIAEKDEYLAVLRSRLIEDALRRRDFKIAAGRYLEGVRQGMLL